MTLLPSNLPIAVRASIAAAVLTVGLAACGGGNDNGSSSTPTTLPGAGAGAHVDTVSAGATWKFVPDSITVPTGGAVTWTNSTDAPHNVVFSNASLKPSDVFTKGKSFTATFPNAGAYPYICSIHPDMKATVVVQ